METSEGEVVLMYVVQANGRIHEVITPEIYGNAADISTKHAIRMCDEGKLIACKIRGLWWIRKAEIDMMRNGSSTDPPNLS